MSAPTGYLALVLHAHLPYVRHPEHADFLEERWFFEAITESYLPLLDAFGRMAAEGVAYQATLSVSPPLAAMLADPLLAGRYVAHLQRLMAFAESEIARHGPSTPLGRLARMYLEKFQWCHRQYEAVHRRDLLAGFRRLADAGYIELMASAATHAYLPLLQGHPEAARAQIRWGTVAHRRWSGRPPAGFWLPECGFDPGTARHLAEAGIQYTIADTHGVLHARPRPRYAVYAPVRCRRSGLTVFGRDPSASGQVWSAESGYPAHPAYRDFYRDAAFDLEESALPPWLRGPGRSFSGLKYHRTGGPDGTQGLYDPLAAQHQARRHAAHFLRSRLATARRIRPLMDRPPVMVAPFDAELFGHWWFEGPLWLENVLRLCGTGPYRGLALATPSRYLEAHGPVETVDMALSSWGEGGYSQTWLARENHWVATELDKALHAMGQLAARFPRPSPLQQRALAQAGRELLLAQSSDWAFIMKQATAVTYARQRVLRHLGRFHSLRQQLLRGCIHPGTLFLWEWQDNLFPELDGRGARTATLGSRAASRSPGRPSALPKYGESPASGRPRRSGRAQGTGGRAHRTGGRAQRTGGRAQRTGGRAQRTGSVSKSALPEPSPVG